MPRRSDITARAVARVAIFPTLRLDELVARPAVTKAYEIGLDRLRMGKPDDESRKNLFDQTADSVADSIREAANGANQAAVTAPGA